MKWEEDLNFRELELRKREEQVEQVKKDQATERERLELREGKVTQDEDFYKKHLLKTNKNLHAKEEKLNEEAATKEKLFHERCSKEFVPKARKQ